MSDKPKFPRADALAATREILAALQPAAERLVVAGSLRRRKDLVGDIELVYIPRIEIQQADGDFWAKEQVNLADQAIARLEAEGILDRRTNVNGSTMFGPKNKLMRHVASGIPVDLFTASSANWWNYLVCRTGSKETNVRIATAAQAKGLEWHPYGVGFADRERKWVRPECEEDVFKIVGLPYLEPWER